MAGRRGGGDADEEMRAWASVASGGRGRVLDLAGPGVSRSERGPKRRGRCYGRGGAAL